MSITIKDNSREIAAMLESAINRGLEKCGLVAEGYAKKNLTQNGSVDTGLLRNSITFALSGEPAAIGSYSADKGDKNGSYTGSAPKDKSPSVYIGTNVEYAA